MSTFFPRGNGPLISVLIPTRGRPHDLRRAIASLWNNAAEPELLEILLRVDDDDKETAAAIKDMEEQYPLTVFSGPRGGGYAELHKYVNDLARQAHGDWLFLFNDDSEILTPSWDRVILNLSCYNKPMGVVPDICLLQFSQHEDANSYSFVALRKKAYEVLEIFSPYLHCDLWLFILFSAMDAIIRVPVQIVHHQDRNDKTAIESKEAATDLWREMKTWMARRRRVCSIHRLTDHIDDKYLKANWYTVPNSTGWWWWRESSEKPEIPMLVFMEEKSFKIVGPTGPLFVMGGQHCMGPARGSDSISCIYNFRDIGGEWSKLQ